MFAVGGVGKMENTQLRSFEQNHNHAEIYSATSLSWIGRPSYPYAPSITNYAIQAVGDEFIIFGGVNFKTTIFGDCSGAFNLDCISSTIASYNPFKNEWHTLGKLKTPRYGHSVALVNNQFIIIGGVYPEKNNFTETYLFNKDKVTFSVETEIPLSLGADLEVMVVPSIYTDQKFQNYCDSL